MDTSNEEEGVMPTRKLPARWRRVDVRVFWRVVPHWELWRGPLKLASVHQAESGKWYWSSDLGPERNSWSKKPTGYIARESAQDAAKEYAVKHEGGAG
jgi:hypothetical protein